MDRDFYEGRDHATLVDQCLRMDKELDMTWKWYDNLSNWVKQTVTCGYCGAGDAQWCHTVTTGKRASYLHADRERQMSEIRGGWGW